MQDTARARDATVILKFVDPTPRPQGEAKSDLTGDL